VSEALTLAGAYTADDARFKVLVVLSTIGIVITAAFLLFAMQRVFLGNLNEKYKDYSDMTFREMFCQVPLLFLCVLLGILPFYLLDWMKPSIELLVKNLGG
jgi:NADH-quinone oxidoreductase subunit M